MPIKKSKEFDSLYSLPLSKVCIRDIRPNPEGFPSPFSGW